MSHFHDNNIGTPPENIVWICRSRTHARGASRVLDGNRCARSALCSNLTLSDVLSGAPSVPAMLDSIQIR